MEDRYYPLFSGLVSLGVALTATYAASFVVPTGDLEWAMTAVGFASFFSGLFSGYYAKRA